MLSACSLSLAEDVTPPPGYQAPARQAPAGAADAEIRLPLTTPNLERGAAIYIESCAPCHGPTGLGDGPQAAQLPNAVAAIGDPREAHRSAPLEWFAVITNGNLDRYMPPFLSKYNTQERWDVLAYVYSLSDTPERVELGHELFQANCAGCHGEDGRGDGVEAADLSVRPPNLTDISLLAERSSAQLYDSISAGIAPDMPGFADELSERERWSLTSYLRMLSFAMPDQSLAAIAPPSAEGAPELESPVAGAEAGKGVVSGVVYTGSGSPLAEALTVTLYGYDGAQEALLERAEIQPDGNFSFENVEMPENRAFFVTVEYLDNTFASDVAVVEDGVTAMFLPITVFETSTDRSMLVVDRLHIFLEYTPPDVLSVTQLYLVSNSSDRVVVAAEESEPVMAFTIPDQARNLRIHGGSFGERMVETADGFGVLGGVPPSAGQYQVIYTYDLTFNGRLSFAQSLDLPVNAVILLLPDEGIKVKSDLLEDAGYRLVQDVNYHVYTSGSLPSGSELPLTLTGGGALALYSDSTVNMVLGLGAFGFVALLAGVWLYRRWPADRSKKPVDAGWPSPSEEAEEIMDAIIALDDLYAAGKLPGKAYRERRSDLKERLRAALVIHDRSS